MSPDITRMRRSDGGAGRHHGNRGMASWIGGLVVGAMVFAAVPVFADDTKRAPDDEPYTFGAFPHLAMVQLEHIFAPIAEEFSRVLGRRVSFRTKPTFEKFTQELEAQTYDIALVQPFDYVPAHDKWGYLPVVRSNKPIAGSILVRTDSPLQSLKDLAGKKLGLPPETAAVSHLTYIALIEAKLNPARDVRVSYHKTHDSCLQQLVIRSIDACASEERPIRFFQQKWNVRFRVLASTPAAPGVVFVAHSRLPKAERDALSNAMLNWARTESGREFMQYGGSQIVSVNDSEFDVVRRYLKSIEAR